MNDRIMSSEEFKEDKDMTIRPVSLDEYVGQSEIKENLGVFIKSSVMRGETLDHILLYGPPGLGKRLLLLILLLMNLVLILRLLVGLRLRRVGT